MILNKCLAVVTLIGGIGGGFWALETRYPTREYVKHADAVLETKHKLLSGAFLEHIRDQQLRAARQRLWDYQKRGHCEDRELYKVSKRDKAPEVCRDLRQEIQDLRDRRPNQAKKG